MDAFEDNTDFTKINHVCEWCSKLTELVENKKYCEKCLENCFRECIRCKKPYPSSDYFVLDKSRCNSCFIKYKKMRDKKTLAGNGIKNSINRKKRNKKVSSYTQTENDSNQEGEVNDFFSEKTDSTDSHCNNGEDDISTRDSRMKKNESKNNTVSKQHKIKYALFPYFVLDYGENFE